MTLAPATLRIVPFSPSIAHHFDRLNREWIQRFFWLEPFDEQMLTQPQATIIDAGGEVWFMEMDGQVVAACALLATADPTVLEFSKLGVDASARGRRIGQQLLHHCIARAKARGMQVLQIFTHSSLATACQLYRDEGFHTIPMTEAEKQRYKRADLMLKLPLTPEAIASVTAQSARSAA